MPALAEIRAWICCLLSKNVLVVNCDLQSWCSFNTCYYFAKESYPHLYPDVLSH